LVYEIEEENIEAGCWKAYKAEGDWDINWHERAQSQRLWKDFVRFVVD